MAAHTSASASPGSDTTPPPASTAGAGTCGARRAAPRSAVRVGQSRPQRLGRAPRPAPHRPPRVSGAGRAPVGGQAAEGAGVADGGAAGVVVEVDVHVGARSAGQAAAMRSSQVDRARAAVGRAGRGRALVEADVAPAGRAPQGRDRVAAAVGPAQRGAGARARPRTSSVHQDSWRGSTATRAPRGKARRQASRRSGSARRVGGSWSRYGPSRSPRPAARSTRRATGSAGSRRRRTWVR